jgi:transcriptional regulator with XRE-family HTH domain
MSTQRNKTERHRPKRKSVSESTNGRRRQFHRIQSVREREGISLRTVSRRTKAPVSELEAQEREDVDIRLSDLYRWQKGLNVPLPELLMEPDAPFADPIRNRACLVRVAKTANTLLANSPTDSVRDLAQTIVNQLSEIMPELKEVRSWHDQGKRRTRDDVGRIALCPVPEEWLLSLVPEEY